MLESQKRAIEKDEDNYRNSRQQPQDHQVHEVANMVQPLGGATV
jgi:hypothetical protein